MSVIVSHPTGNCFVRAAVNSLQELHYLQEFHTAVAIFPDSLAGKLSRISGFRELQRRRLPDELQSRTFSAPWREVGRVLAGRAKLNRLIRHESGMLSVDAVYNDIDRRVANRLHVLRDRGPNSVYAYEDGALATFQMAKKLGIACLYDLPIGYWRAARELLSLELERWPQWANTIAAFADSEAKTARKDEELRLADRIFVASSFTKKTLDLYPGKLGPIEVIPYGFPDVPDAGFGTLRGQFIGNRPLKLLFVGGLSQRKGVADLFAAVENIGPTVSLTVVGRKPNLPCAALDAALARHHWIPSLPHEQVLNLMSAHDVLVFPSLFEGFGMVITEAMSRGTPVITTDRTAGPDLIEHGRNGWLIKAGSVNALQAQIEELLTCPALISTAGEEAVETARKRPWKVYGLELAESAGRHQ